MSGVIRRARADAGRRSFEPEAQLEIFYEPDH
jgi:hypothetical protein